MDRIGEVCTCADEVLGNLLVNPKESKPMLCLVACMLLKMNRSLAFVHSCFFYGNGCIKQVSSAPT